MTFYDEIERFRSLDLTGITEGFTPIHIEQILAKSEIHWQELLGLLSPAATGLLENMAQAAHKLTIKHFGRTILLYTPLYLSNYCVNQCVYCGFNMANDIPRRKLTLHEVELEAQAISGTGLQTLVDTYRRVPPAFPRILHRRLCLCSEKILFFNFNRGLSFVH